MASRTLPALPHHTFPQPQPSQPSVHDAALDMVASVATALFFFRVSDPVGAERVLQSAYEAFRQAENRSLGVTL